MDSSPPSVLSILVLKEPYFQTLLSFEMTSRDIRQQIFDGFRFCFLPGDVHPIVREINSYWPQRRKF